MKHIAKRLLSLLLVVCLVLSVAVIPAGAAETKLTSVYASYAAKATRMPRSRMTSSRRSPIRSPSAS